MEMIGISGDGNKASTRRRTPLASPPIKSTLIRRVIMRDLASGVFLGFMAFTLPLAIYVMTTGGLV